MPEYKNETIMVGKNRAQRLTIMMPPSDAQHQQENNCRNDPAEAGKANLRAYKPLQHERSGPGHRPGLITGPDG